MANVPENAELWSSRHFIPVYPALCLPPDQPRKKIPSMIDFRPGSRMSI
jgi:hypothetical protein